MKVIQTTLKQTDLHKIIDLNGFIIGDIVPFDIFIKKENNYIIIIEAGTILSKSLYAKLGKQENLYILKSDEYKLTLTWRSLKYYTKHNKDNLKYIVSFIYKINTELFDDYVNNQYDYINLKCVRSILKSIIFLIKYHDNFLKETILHFSSKHYCPNHALHVAIYSMCLGHELDLSNKELLQLGTAAILHDLGIKKVNYSIIYKNDKLTSTELEKVRKHSQYSVHIIQQNNLHDPYIIEAVMQHHERYDGQGYPNQLKQGEISSFASILSICDVFDALTSERPYRTKYTSFDAVKLMMRDESMVNKFNVQYLQLLVKML